ncbi:MAG: PspC domain-containing protein [Acidimicrobiia bacterium]|nr:PspC domain-containing protein [Acidimicrobiia bacterium]
MATPASGQLSSAGPPNFGVYRRRDDRVVAGLASGMADAVGIDAAYVRAAFVALLAVSGLGGLFYLIGWAMTSSSVVDARSVPSDPIVPASPIERHRTIGAGLAFGGVLLALSHTVLWLGASSGAVTLTAFGLATLWARSDRVQRTRWTNALLRGEWTEKSRRELGLRAGAGGFLILVGLTILFTATDTLRSVGAVLLAALVTGGGLMLVLGPWMYRLWSDLREERRERIRSEEREDLAAHLHDSVLQTLALIQRSKNPEEQAILARIQERELRSWLFGYNGDNGGSFAKAIESAAASVERDHQIAVDVVTVGDCDLDPGVDAVVKAAREAMVNAAKHSGARILSVFAEVDTGEVEVFVTDQGIGFDTAAVNDDRHGISDSIVARMARHGGSADIDSEPGEGTEVHLRIARSVR